jgi:hypothetical protein
MPVGYQPRAVAVLGLRHRSCAQWHGARRIKACRLYGAKLVIAKIDRLSRDAHFLLGLIRKIAAHLAERGYVTPSGRPYSASAIASMLGEK